MNAIGACLTLLHCLVVFAGTRRWALAAMIIGVCYLPQEQEISLGLHFTAMRLIILAALARVMAKGELRRLQFNKIDRVFAVYYVSMAAISTLRVGTTDELIYQSGGLYNAFLSYFSFRALIQEDSDFKGALSIVAYAIAPVAILMVLESLSGTSAFHIMGAAEFSMVRDGHVRSQGALRSPITAGAFGATLGVFYLGLFSRKEKLPGQLIGLLSSVVIVATARSSGPLLGFMVGALSLACWVVRKHVNKIRWGIAISLVTLHLLMKAPVWFLLGRISDIVGGGGYHRAYLIDRFVNRFSDWWLLGTSDTSDWMATQLETGGADLTNQFVADGVRAGLVGFCLGIYLLVLCFGAIGRAMDVVRTTSPSSERLLWVIGCSLTTTIAILFSVTYFDQMHIIWFFLLGVTGSLGLTVLRESTSSENPLPDPSDSECNSDASTS